MSLTPGTILGKLQARDADQGPNALLYWTLSAETIAIRLSSADSGTLVLADDENSVISTPLNCSIRVGLSNGGNSRVHFYAVQLFAQSEDSHNLHFSDAHYTVKVSIRGRMT